MYKIVHFVLIFLCSPISEKWEQWHKLGSVHFSSFYVTGFFPEAVTQRCSLKKVLLKISQNSQENTFVRVSFLLKSQAPACDFMKKEALAQVFSSEFARNFL